MRASSFVLDSGYDLPPSWTDEHATTHKKRARSRALFGSATGFAPRACGSLDQNRPRWKGATWKPAAAPAQLSPRANPVQGRLGFCQATYCATPWPKDQFSFGTSTKLMNTSSFRRPRRAFSS